MQRPGDWPNAAVTDIEIVTVLIARQRKHEIIEIDDKAGQHDRLYHHSSITSMHSLHSDCTHPILSKESQRSQMSSSHVNNSVVSSGH